MLWGDAKLSAVVLCVSSDVAGALSVAGIDIVLASPAAIRVDAASDHALGKSQRSTPSYVVGAELRLEGFDIQQHLQSWQQW